MFLFLVSVFVVFHLFFKTIYYRTSITPVFWGDLGSNVALFLNPFGPVAGYYLEINRDYFLTSSPFLSHLPTMIIVAHNSTFDSRQFVLLC